MTLRIAMWSGPRNISTAMMRAWENRSDTAVWDEPLYAYYLNATRLEHPGRDEIIAAGQTDWTRVVAKCLGPAPGDAQVFFQKHMTHHLLPEMDRSWMAQLHNCFLIRDPRAVIASYARIRDRVTIEDVGIVQQAEIVRHVREMTGRDPVIMDAQDILRAPRRMLGALCETVGCPFDEAMLEWPAGGRASDGVWAQHWYRSVEASTGFAPYVAKNPSLPAAHEELAERCAAAYEQMRGLALRA